MSRLSAPITPRLDDDDVERVRREHDQKIRELQKQPGVGMGVIANVVLRDGIATPIPHRLGRLPIWVRESSPRGPSSAGYVEEIRDSTHDRTKFVVLKASGWGATITVDVAVM